MSNPLPDSKRAEIEAAIFQSRKIDAIKLYRAATGAGLSEAKDCVEKMEAELRSKFPDRFSATTTSKGCRPAVLMFAAACLLFVLVIVKLLT